MRKTELDRRMEEHEVQATMAVRLFKLELRNRELEKRVAELERRLAG